MEFWNYIKFGHIEHSEVTFGLGEQHSLAELPQDTENINSFAYKF